MIDKQTALAILKSSLPLMEKRYHVKKIGIFGSVAAGRVSESSDIDIYIELSEPIGLEYFEMLEYLEGKFNRKVDVITAEGLRSIRRDTTKQSIERGIIYV